MKEKIEIIRIAQKEKEKEQLINHALEKKVKNIKALEEVIDWKNLY